MTKYNNVQLINRHTKIATQIDKNQKPFKFRKPNTTHVWEILNHWSQICTQTYSSKVRKFSKNKNQINSFRKIQNLCSFIVSLTVDNATRNTKNNPFFTVAAELVTSSPTWLVFVSSVLVGFSDVFLTSKIL